MERNIIAPRANWQQRVESLGFDWHTPGRPYWDESVYYRFTPADVERLRDAAITANTMMFDTIENGVREGLGLYGYDDAISGLMAASWQQQKEGKSPVLFGRYNFAYDGVQPKLISFDGDIPGGIFETSMVQKAWAGEVTPNTAQFNRLHEGIVAGLRSAAALNRARGFTTLHIAYEGQPGEEMTGVAGYLNNAATEAGANPMLIGLADLGFKREEADGEAANYFVDLNESPVTTLLKLAPLPWMFQGDLGDDLIESVTDGELSLLEAPWKALATNKRTLAAMWSLYSYHPLLLQTSTMEADLTGAYVKKPLNGMYGCNITALGAPGSAPFGGRATEDSTQGDFGDDDYVFQERAPVPQIDGNFPIVQVWVSGNDAVALSVKESTSLISDMTARFVPHVVADAPI